MLCSVIIIAYDLVFINLVLFLMLYFLPAFKTLHNAPLQRLFNIGTKLFHSLNHEHHLFDQIPHPNAASVNTAVYDLLHKNLPFQALAISKKQFQLHFIENVDEDTLALSLKACQGELKLGRQIHGFSVSTGFASHVKVLNSLMKMYCTSGNFGSALRIFEKNLSFPDIVSWNTILSGFEKSVDALNFARSMHFNGIVFDHVTYTTALAFCWDDCGFLFGWKLHSLVLKYGFGGEVFVGNALITMYSR